MKLIVCGKGGSGKSTVTALLAREFAREEKRAVVLDTDVSNGGLHRLLGTAAAPDLVEHFGGSRSWKARLREAAPLCRWTIDTIPGDFAPRKDGVRLVTIAKLWDASEGCTCSISALAREFLLGLELGKDDRLIVDTEAGVEHFGRGLDKLCDAIVLVIDPSYESVCLTHKVLVMAKAVQIPLFFVLNRTDPTTRDSLCRTLPERDRILGEFPLDPELMKAGLEGNAVPFGYPPARSVLEALTTRLQALRQGGAARPRRKARS